MALNPIQTAINRLKTTDRKTYEYFIFFIQVVISAGDMNLL